MVEWFTRGREFVGSWGREFMGPIPSIHSHSVSVFHSEFILILILCSVLELVERLILCSVLELVERLFLILIGIA